MNQNPLVTICLLTHNSQKTLEKTLNSILNQTYSNFEILISDNYSKDKTREIITSFQKKYPDKITFRQNQEPTEKDEDYIGCYYNYNSCIKSGLIKGDLVCFFHDDDIYNPKIIEKEVRAFLENPQIGAVFATAFMIDKNDKTIGELKLPKKLRKKNIYTFNEIFEALLYNGNIFLQTPTFMAKSKIISNTGPFDEKKFRTSADLEVWLRILENYPICIINENLICWRKSDGGSAMYQHSRTQRADYFKVMDYYLYQKKINKKLEKMFLRQYNYQKYLDDALLAMNFLMKNDILRAKEMINKPASFNILKALLENFKLLRVKIFTLRIVLFMGINMGLGKYLRKMLSIIF